MAWTFQGRKHIWFVCSCSWNLLVNHLVQTILTRIDFLHFAYFYCWVGYNFSQFPRVLFVSVLLFTILYNTQQHSYTVNLVLKFDLVNRLVILISVQSTQQTVLLSALARGWLRWGTGNIGHRFRNASWNWTNRSIKFCLSLLWLELLVWCFPSINSVFNVSVSLFVYILPWSF